MLSTRSVMALQARSRITVVQGIRGAVLNLKVLERLYNMPPAYCRKMSTTAVYYQVLYCCSIPDESLL